MQFELRHNSLWFLMSSKLQSNYNWSRIVCDWNLIETSMQLQLKSHQNCNATIIEVALSAIEVSSKLQRNYNRSHIGCNWSLIDLISSISAHNYNLSYDITHNSFWCHRNSNATTIEITFSTIEIWSTLYHQFQHKLQLLLQQLIKIMLTKNIYKICYTSSFRETSSAAFLAESPFSFHKSKHKSAYNNKETKK